MERLSQIPCKVSQGLFASEVCVDIDTPNGEHISGWFDQSYVSFDGDLTENHSLDGKFRVEVIEEDQNSILLRIGSTGNQILQGHSSIRVPKDFLLTQEE